MSILTNMSNSLLELPINYKEASRETRRQAREQYIIEQHGLCSYCGGSLDKVPSKLMREFPINKNIFPKLMFSYPVHLHHCHDTGMTIGAVHAYCNAILWQYHGE